LVLRTKKLDSGFRRNDDCAFAGRRSTGSRMAELAITELSNVVIPAQAGIQCLSLLCGKR